MNPISRVFFAVGLALVALCIGASSALAGTGDGMVKGVTKLVDNGPTADRFNLVLIGDGYRESELGLFEDHADEFVKFLFETPPFNTNCSAINIWRIDVVSTDSGADDPAPPADDPMTTPDESLRCGGGTGATANTYFDASFCSDGIIRRLLGVDGGIATSVLNAQVPGWDQALVIVNSATYGGSGGTVGVTSVSGTWENIAIHEFGHSAFGLADEYEYWAGCGVDTDRNNHPAGEPVQPNVTLETNPSLLKWKDLVEVAATPLPTTENADCSVCDSQADPFPGDQVVGLYEGAHYYHCDSYRPVYSCMMRNFDLFCPVCTQRILQTLATYQPPNGTPTCDADGPYVAECAGTSTGVKVDGSGSSDPDCDPLTFAWTGPFAGSPASGAMPTLTFSGTGDFGVSLEVMDNENAAKSCNTTVKVQDTTPPVIVAPPAVTVECSGPTGQAVALGTPITSDVCDPSLTVSSDAPALFPLGTTIVTWKATDDAGLMATATQAVVVEDTTPPEITLALSPTTLWPPNHKLYAITAAIQVRDICDANPQVTLLSAVSDEPDDATGDGHTSNDVQGADVGTDDRKFQVRAERKGNGDGRIYTVRYQAEDDSGNTTPAEGTVSVAKSQGKK